jgi:hypothetical protein
MWCNYYNTEAVGSQPVRVLKKELFKEFNNIRSALHSWFPLSQLNKIDLDYVTGKHNMAGPYATAQKIHIDETFLSAFWNYCFGIIFSTPLGQTDKGEVLKNCNPYDSLEYCRSLFTKYEPWNLEQLPNPELGKKELIGAINFTNRVYSNGLNFILFHEFAHIIRGDVFEPHISKAKSHEMEFACDLYAFEVFATSVDLTNPEVVLGILCATGLITFCSTFADKDAQTHPFPDERLVKILKGFAKHSNLEKNNNIWGIAIWILFTWDFLNNKCFPGSEGSVLNIDAPENYKDAQKAFSETLERLQNKKIWTS